MAIIRHKTVVPSRRRREEDGEEEASLAEDIEDDSLSEGSAISSGDDDADIEGSDLSEDEVVQVPVNNHIETVANTQSVEAQSSTAIQSDTQRNGAFQVTADPEAMLNGLKIVDEGNENAEINLDDTTAENGDLTVLLDQQNRKAQLKEAFAGRDNKEQQDYFKQRNENPAFVPTKGGFFLHDNRSAGPTVNGFRPPTRGRGRAAYNSGQSGRGSVPQPADQRWAHDLHESLSRPETVSIHPTNPPSVRRPAKAPEATVSALLPTFNPSFSTSTLIGNVSVTIYLPGMAKRTSVPNVVKKQHTLLPQHRPPLRRDKPVRVSLPGQPPRYIFPSIGRSFIFIPRALRPNQQSFGRVRGRGSFHGSRRTSVYGGSAYTPSIALSRRSSLGGPITHEAVLSPTGSVPRHDAFNPDLSKPVVRLPPNTRTAIPLPGAVQALPYSGPLVAASVSQPIALQQDGAIQENRGCSPTMHQPRPQKTVSVADIETPATFTFNPPQQQQEQPFHQQVPPQVNGLGYVEESMVFNPHSRHPSHPSQPSGTPLSQIPERAIYAQPFQPFPLPHPQGYCAPAYPQGTVFYPAMAGEVSNSTGAMAPAVMAPTFVPASHLPSFLVAPPLPASGADATAPTGTLAHESNGMVYYYDTSQLPQSSNPAFPPQYPVAANGGVVGMTAMMTPPGHYYYPQAPAGVYYGGQ